MTDNIEYANEITLKEFIIKLKYYLKELARNWYILVLSSVLLGLVFGVRAYFTEIKYISELTFMVNEDSGPSVNSIAANVLGRFVGGGGKYNLEKILSLSKSMNIMEKTLLQKSKIDGKSNFLANFFIEEYKLNQKTYNGELDGFFFSKDTISSEKDSRMMAVLFNMLVGEQGLFSASTDEKSGIMTLKLICKNEELAVGFVNTLFNILSEYYINKSIEKEQITYDLLKQKANALYGQMDTKLDYSIHHDDNTLGVWQEASKLPSMKNLRDARISTEMYGEVMKNLEIADFTLKSKTPFIQEIDVPRIPLAQIKNSLIKKIAIGGVLGIFLSVLFVVGRRTIVNAMNE